MMWNFIEKCTTRSTSLHPYFMKKDHAFQKGISIQGPIGAGSLPELSDSLNNSQTIWKLNHFKLNDFNCRQV